ncbi:MAG: glucosamine-6-phosphate deaminase, partial [Thermoanaerobaculia bacterium]|nr:glucosamine-6-phosphate deaminase [Thermoanaerobaculia bacterium]
PTGRTMVPVYAELVRRHREGSLDLSSTYGFNLDELLLPEGHPSSFRRFMEDHAFDHGLLPRNHWDIPRSTSDPEAECRRYDAALERAGGLDLAILGLGSDGHVAYNLPGPPHALTHVVEVPESVARPDDLEEAWLPLRAITMGIETLRSASHVLLLATGASKAQAVWAFLKGPVTPEWPCSLLREHPNLDVVLDGEATALLADPLFSH